MNEVRRINPDHEAKRIAEQIVERHRSDFPEFITDFGIKLGYSDGEPALFILLKEVDEGLLSLPQDWHDRANAFSRLENIVLPELIDAVDGWFPYAILVPDTHWGTFPD